MKTVGEGRWGVQCGVVGAVGEDGGGNLPMSM